MKVPKNYFHTKSVVVLLSANLALALLVIMYVVLSVDTSESVSSVISYRDTTKIGQITGTTSELYQFALFGALITGASIILSLRLFHLRKHVAEAVLGLNVITLLLTIIVFNALGTLNG